MILHFLLWEGWAELHTALTKLPVCFVLAAARMSVVTKSVRTAREMEIWGMVINFDCQWKLLWPGLRLVASTGPPVDLARRNPALARIDSNAVIVAWPW